MQLALTNVRRYAKHSTPHPLAIPQIRLEKDNEGSLMFVTVDTDALQAAAAAAKCTGSSTGSTPTSSGGGARGSGAIPEGLQVVVDHAGKSEPLFLFYRNGQLKAKVYGANLPKITANVYEHTPANPEVDNIEDNPFSAARREGGGKEGAGKKGKKGAR